MTETRQTERNESNSKNKTLNSKRVFHQVQASTYWLPKDEEEQCRLIAVSHLYINITITHAQAATFCY